MSWDEVGYALNSRVIGDASNMKSLDVLIDEIKALNAQMQTTLNTVNSLANTINTNVNAVKTETAKNNTANATGTLSQKMTQVNNTVNAINSLATKGLRPNLLYKTITKTIEDPNESANGYTLLSLSNVLLYGFTSKIYIDSSVSGERLKKRMIIKFGSLGSYMYSAGDSDNKYARYWPYVARPDINPISKYLTNIDTLLSPIFVNSLSVSIEEDNNYYSRGYYVNLVYAQL